MRLVAGQDIHGAINHGIAEAQAAEDFSHARLKSMGKWWIEPWFHHEKDGDFTGFMGDDI